jgi:hypothetical protein
VVQAVDARRDGELLMVPDYTRDDALSSSSEDIREFTCAILIAVIAVRSYSTV